MIGLWEKEKDRGGKGESARMRRLDRTEGGNATLVGGGEGQNNGRR